jgi:hypothetical protein
VRSRGPRRRRPRTSRRVPRLPRNFSRRAGLPPRQRPRPCQAPRLPRSFGETSHRLRRAPHPRRLRRRQRPCRRPPPAAPRCREDQARRRLQRRINLRRQHRPPAAPRCRRDQARRRRQRPINPRLRRSPAELPVHPCSVANPRRHLAALRPRIQRHRRSPSRSRPRRPRRRP